MSLPFGAVISSIRFTYSHCHLSSHNLLSHLFTYLYSVVVPEQHSRTLSLLFAHTSPVLLALKYTHFDSELWAIVNSYCISYLVTLCDSVIDTFDYPDKCTHSVAV